ncbi:aminodeoxychorismate lyase [Corynebacterium felinum]|uniref:4-amino-4-deoxychorismate lyase n=1 Tax=Corynebacterium felinum TaxID=131318 RepID=A0ABU2B541_9CORY|nr:aminodeoxychorismate lyase [Corynebacterium felinum]MDF5821678.1 aminodeoxychorismate lyase [Corynebacterium felinum]MDR7353730.1 4-amino-4-deoxychorismate lyase [Corynebacterium felinum]WJY95909.1 D-alanine aminotransferase [Corynebacterium felinum]
MAFTPAPIIYAIEPFGGSIRDHNPNLPLVYADDAAVTRGDGIFETLLVRGGELSNFDRHFERFYASAQLLDLPLPIKADWQRASNQAVQVWLEQWANAGAEPIDGALKWTLTRGRESTQIPSAWLSVHTISPTQLHQREHGVAVMTSPKGYHIDQHAQTPWLTVGAKTLNYAATMAALRWAKTHGFDDVLYTDGDTVLEGATSTLISVKGTKIRTPLGNGQLLTGTTQQALFEHASSLGWRCKQKDLTLEDLFRADSVWLISSVRIAARITSIDGTKLPTPENESEIRELIEQSLKVKSLANDAAKLS